MQRESHSLGNGSVFIFTDGLNDELRLSRLVSVQLANYEYTVDVSDPSYLGRRKNEN